MGIREWSLRGAAVAYAHRTLHDATRRDNPRQENRVMCGGLRHDATRQDKNRALSQISSIVRSLTTRPDFCLVVSRRVVDPRTLHDFLVGGCRVVSCRVVSCNVRWALMDCHATARGSIPGWNGVFTELHVLRKGQ